MNVWQPDVLERFKSIIRLLLWVALVAHAAMFSVFSVLVTFQFLRHAFTWTQRVLFSHEW